MTPTKQVAIDLEHQLTRGFAARFIRRKAKALVGLAGIRHSDREDIEQELKLNLIHRLPKFDPAIGHWNAFVVTITDRCVATLLQKRRCRKRDHLMDRIDPIHSETPVFDDTEFTSRVDLTLDINGLLAGLPRELRDICKALQVHSISGAARQLAIPRSTLCERLREVRVAFAAASFQENHNPLRQFAAISGR